MIDFDLLSVLVGMAGALLGAGAAFVASKSIYGRQLADQGARLDKIERARAQTNEMLSQAKKQIEGLQKDLDDARRAGRKAAKAESRRDAAGSDDKAREIAETRARLDRMLDDPASALGNGGFVNSGMARGFADTQPISAFPSTQPRAA